jgi:hypothetical protein
MIILLSSLYFIPLIAKSTVRSLLLEDADYDGRSLSMLQKIDGALNQTVEIKFSVIAS